MSQKSSENFTIAPSEDRDGAYAEVVSLVPYETSAGGAFVNVSFFCPRVEHILNENGAVADASVKLFKVKSVTLPKSAFLDLKNTIDTLIEKEGW